AYAVQSTVMRYLEMALRKAEAEMRVHQNYKELSSMAVLSGFFILMIATMSFGQVTNSSIVGTVTDASGAAVPGAQVTATKTSTNFSRMVSTNSQGEYRIEFLPVGAYKIVVTANGFQ